MQGLLTRVQLDRWSKTLHQCTTNKTGAKAGGSSTPKIVRSRLINRRKRWKLELPQMTTSRLTPKTIPSFLTAGCKWAYTRTTWLMRRFQPSSTQQIAISNTQVDSLEQSSLKVESNFKANDWCNRNIQIESDKHIRDYGQVQTGNVAVTNAGNMKDIRYIIHTVGPIVGSIWKVIALDSNFLVYRELSRPSKELHLQHPREVSAVLPWLSFDSSHLLWHLRLP